MLLTIFIAVLTHASGDGVPVAQACTGGLWDFQSASAEAQLIFIGDVIEAGDGVNREPTLTPVPTATRSPYSTPVSPPVSRPTFDIQVDLNGIGELFDVQREIVGHPGAPFALDGEIRRGIEREIRYINATGGFSDCEIDRGTFRYIPGARYLVFAGQPPGVEFTLTLQRLHVVGADVVFDEPGSSYAPFVVSRELYDAAFRGIASQPYGESPVLEITADRVPLTTVLRAVAYIRGDPSIAPPDTGSAGLASGRR
jgi:hypothetical protein